MTQQPENAGLARLLQADANLSARMEISSRGLRFLALVFAHSGDSPLWLPGGLALLIWGGEAWRPFGVRILLATLLGGGIASLLKLVFRRSRPAAPFAALYNELIDRHAFPSAHATRAGCVVVTLAPLLPAWGVGLMAVWALLVCLARVALQVHYLLDVTVGLVLGMSLGLVLIAFL